MAQFNWQSEEDAWDVTPPQAPTPPRRWFWPVFILGILLLTIGGAYLAYWRFNQQVEQVLDETTEKVLTSHNLVLEATANADPELYANLLSGRDVAWTETQVRLLNMRLLFNRPYLGLNTVEIRPSIPPTVTIDPQLTQAIVTSTVVYTSAFAAEPIELQHVSVYRRGSDRWLMAPLTTEGDWTLTEEYVGQRLAAVYPLPDKAHALPLAQRLDQMLDAICSGFFDVECDPELYLHLSFDNNPQSLIQMNRPLFNGMFYSLPTPTLAGLPTDTASQEALTRAYAELILAPYLDGAIQTYWAGREQFIQLALHHHRQELGLASPAPRPVNPAPPPTISQEIALLCYTNQDIGLLTFNPAEAELKPKLKGQVFTNLLPNPADEMVALTERLTSSEEERVVLWNIHEPQTHVFPHSNPVLYHIESFSWRNYPPYHRLMIASRLKPPNNGNNGNNMPLFFKDVQFLNSCTSGNCPILSNDFYYDIFWSPDEQHTVLFNTVGQLFVGDTAGTPRQFMSYGLNPVWLDNEQFVYVRPLGTPEPGFYLAQVADYSTTRLLTPNDLTQAAEIPGIPMNLIYADQNPADPHRFVLFALAEATPGTQHAYLFEYNQTTQELTFLFTSPQLYAFNQAPSGETLAVTFLSPQNQHEVYVIHLPSQTTQPYTLPSRPGQPVIDWSQNGQWLLVLENGQLTLLDTQNQQFYSYIPDNYGSCLQAGWITPS